MNIPEPTVFASTTPPPPLIPILLPVSGVTCSVYRLLAMQQGQVFPVTRRLPPCNKSIPVTLHLRVPVASPWEQPMPPSSQSAGRVFRLTSVSSEQLVTLWARDALCVHVWRAQSTQRQVWTNTERIDCSHPTRSGWPLNLLPSFTRRSYTADVCVHVQHAETVGETTDSPLTPSTSHPTPF